MMRLRVIIVLQLLALAFGLFNIGYYYPIDYFPTLAMLLWGGVGTAAMLILVLIGRSDLLRNYGLKGSILAMVGINSFFMIFHVVDR